MKTKATFARFLVLVLVLLAGRCSGGNTVVGPPPPTNDPTPTPTPTAGGSSPHLAGEWSGTLAFRVQQHSGEFPCSAPVSGTLAQNGSSVTARLTSTCGGNVRFTATLAGGTISGTLATDAISGAHFDGSASDARISFQTGPGADTPGIVILDLSR